MTTSKNLINKMTGAIQNMAINGSKAGDKHKQKSTSWNNIIETHQEPTKWTNDYCCINHSSTLTAKYFIPRRWLPRWKIHLTHGQHSNQDNNKKNYSGVYLSNHQVHQHPTVKGQQHAKGGHMSCCGWGDSSIRVLTPKQTSKTQRDMETLLQQWNKMAAQSIPGQVKGSNTIFSIKNSKVTQNRNRDVIYGHIICD